MHVTRNFFFASGLMAQCFCAHAEILSSETTVIDPSFQEKSVPRFPVSVQLRDDEVAALLEHLQSQHVYLKHLENVQNAVERELSIVRLMSECDRLGNTCTGRGIAKKIAPAAFEGKGSIVSPSSPPPPPSPPSLSPVPASSLPVAELPELVAVYHGTASMFYKRRYTEVREGEKLGPFTVRLIDVDGVKITGPRGTFFLSPGWNPPRGVSSAAYRESGSLVRYAR